MLKTAMALVIALTLCATFTLADISPQITYQGRLTDASGAPVADGTYTMTFNIYKSKLEVSPFWSSGARTVAVSGGLFTYKLGAAVPLPQNTFIDKERWLGIKVGSDPEISPRTQITSTPYAYQALFADTASALSNEDDFLHAAGDTLGGYLYFDGDGDGRSDGFIAVNSGAASIFLKSDDSTTVYLYGDTFGELALRGDDGVRRVDLGAFSSGGRLHLEDYEGVEQIRLTAGSTGDYSVVIPDNAINSDEILDEPGVVANTNASDVALTSTTTMTDIVTVSITPPGPGYILVTARFQFALSGTTGTNAAYAQIDQTAGGGTNTGKYSLWYQDAFPSTGYYHYPVYTEEIYFVSDNSTRTYRLEGMKSSAATGSCSIRRSHITARYFPTSYGSVSKIQPEAGDFTDVEPITEVDEEGHEGSSYIVDLRELEMKVKEAKIKALEAELELRRALEETERNERE